jgi:hypothetical protein
VLGQSSGLQFEDFLEGQYCQPYSLDMLETISRVFFRACHGEIVPETLEPL